MSALDLYRDHEAKRAHDLNRSVTMNKLLGLMECGAEPRFHEGAWTVQYEDRAHGRTSTRPIDSGVIAQLRGFGMCEIVRDGQDQVCRLKKVG